MARKVTVAATQMKCSAVHDENLQNAEKLVRVAAAQGANIVLLQELFETPYFCKDQKPEYFEWATTVEESSVIQKMSRLAAELEVVLPVSFFEKSGNSFFNSLVVIDADGKVLDNYRKSHIPDGPGYQEKYYFSPGDTGFKVWETRFAKIGVGICWDQWFPEAARSMALQGAELIFYPTAIGSEPPDPEYDSCDHWTRTMQGHAAANIVPVIASNRIGEEIGETCSITFYGSSFIAGPAGELLQKANREDESVLLHQFDLDEIRSMRSSWGLFRDRRPELYRTIMSLDGR